jgi:hypothetical protein
VLQCVYQYYTVHHLDADQLILNTVSAIYYVKYSYVLPEDGIARPQVVNGEDGLQVWKVAASKWGKH